MSPKINTQHQTNSESNTTIFVYCHDRNLAKLKQLGSNARSLAYCTVETPDGNEVTQDHLYDEHFVNQLVNCIRDQISEFRSSHGEEHKVVVIGHNVFAELVLDLLIKDNELFDGAILMKPRVNIAISEGFVTYKNQPVLVTFGAEESDEKNELESEVAELLMANGFRVTQEVILNDGNLLTDLDITSASEWLKVHF